jgi:putative sporulation protein YtaF
MLPALSLLVLALAVSLDGFGAGVMYGLRKIRIPVLSVIIVALCSGTIIFLSIQIGSWLLNYMSPETAKRLGSFILIGIGIWAVLQVFLHKKQEKQEAAPPKEPHQEQTEPFALRKIIHIEIKKLGLVIEILRTPSKADMDSSGTISASEALLLGIALSLDAFGAGIGAGLIGFSPLLTAAAIGISCGICIKIGLHVGYIFAKHHWVRRISVLPGFILIIVGILKLM